MPYKKVLSILHSTYTFIFVVAASVLVYTLMPHNKPVRIIAAGILVLYFALWGITQHSLKKLRSLPVIFEYIALSLLGLALVLFLIYYD